MIKKILSIFFVVFLCCLAFSVNARYVRKYVKPNFFVPENIFNKPEKLPPLQRNNDDKSVKKISRSDIIQENEYNNINITLLVLPHKFLMLNVHFNCQSFPSLLLILDNFYCYIFRFTHTFLCKSNSPMMLNQ